MVGVVLVVEEELLQQQHLVCRVVVHLEWVPPEVLMTSRAPSADTGPWTGHCRGNWARQIISISRDCVETEALPTDRVTTMHCTLLMAKRIEEQRK